MAVAKDACGNSTDPSKGLLSRPFKIIAFDWDGTAVVSRSEDASIVRGYLERLLGLGVYVSRWPFVSTPDPTWVMEEDGFEPELESEVESLFTVSG